MSGNHDRVVIAGAGPVGLTAALVLASEGVPVTVLEAGPTVSTQSRASTFHPPTLDMLDRFGISEKLTRMGVIADRYQLRDRETGPFAEFDLRLLRKDTAHPFRVQCEQHNYAALALQHLRELPAAEIRFSAEVIDAEEGTTGVTARVRSPAGVTEVTGAFLIGADGARSVVRQALGVKFEGMTYPERYLVATTSVDFKSAMPDLAYVNYVSDPREFFVLLRLPDLWRAMFPVPPVETDEEAITEDSVQRRLQGVAERSEPYQVVHRTLYRVHQRVATTFRVGHVLLAGDAAHINNPLGGMGMNSGIHDAFVLGSALAGVVGGELSERDLNDYAAERRRVAIEYIRPISHESATRIKERDHAARLRYQEEMRRMAENPRTAREYLLRNTLIASLREAGVLPAPRAAS